MPHPRADLYSFPRSVRPLPCPILGQISTPCRSLCALCLAPSPGRSLLLAEVCAPSALPLKTLKVLWLDSPWGLRSPYSPPLCVCVCHQHPAPLLGLALQSHLCEKRQMRVRRALKAQLSADASTCPLTASRSTADGTRQERKAGDVCARYERAPQPEHLPGDGCEHRRGRQRSGAQHHQIAAMSARHTHLPLCAAPEGGSLAQKRSRVLMTHTRTEGESRGSADPTANKPKLFQGFKG